MYAVIDDGTFWFDPDGMFNDPRYDSSDPQSDNYVPGSATPILCRELIPFGPTIHRAHILKSKTSSFQK